MSTLKRFQIDLTEDELRLIERLGSLAGLRTKKDVVLNAITLLRWACSEIMYGRSICSVDDRTGRLKQVELPALTAIAEKTTRTEPSIPERVLESGKRFGEFAPINMTGEPNVASILDTKSGSGLDAGMGSSPEKR